MHNCKLNNKGDYKTAEEKLKPCPFCSGEAQMIKFKGHEVFIIKCRVCGMGSDTYRPSSEAIAAWNRRPKLRTNFERWKEGLTVEDLVKREGIISPRKHYCHYIGNNADVCDNGISCQECTEQWANAEVSDED